MVRLQKYLAEAGVASRRASEQIILDGRVSINGHVIRELGSKVDPAHDRVALDGKTIRAGRKLYVALNKPRGCIASRNDPDGRPSVYDLLPKPWRTLHTVGRLDYNTEGLIFLTNDGDFSLRLTHPRYAVQKRYLATVEGNVGADELGQMTRGLHHEGEFLRAERARVIKRGQGTSLVELVLTEGKNREVRRLFEAQHITVKHLERVQIGPIKLGELRRGHWRTLTDSEIKSLLAKGVSERGATKRDKNT